MKEITRIHIAKTPYEIETAAKKQLETYIRALEGYNIEAEIIEDIEVRMTEILAERDVKKGAVIASADVAALKKQLGEPEDFMADGDIAVGMDETESSSGAARKLYRDGDNAVIGGVLAGIAAFFNVNPMWVRLIFILLALMSFGTAILVYAVLWIAVPEAKTAADKLQMRGQPVTLGSIRKVNESEVRRPLATGNGRRAALTILGIFCVLGATFAAIMTLAALFGGMFFSHHSFSSAGGDFLLAAYVLALISGLLLIVLFILGAYASFARKFTRRVVISICAVIVLGLATFGTAAGLAQYGSMRDIQVIRENTRETSVSLPTGKITALATENSDIRVRYIVSKNAPSAKLRATAKDAADMPKVAMKLENGILKVSVKHSAGDCGVIWGCDRPVLTIYGPALAKVAADEQSLVEYNADQQQKLEVDARREADVSVMAGTIETLAIITGRDASVSAMDATVHHLKVAMKTSANVEAGTVHSVTLSHDNACPAHGASYLTIEAVMDGKMTVNGVEQPARSGEMGCVKINIESEEK